jgi:hypothetical protein
MAVVRADDAAAVTVTALPQEVRAAALFSNTWPPDKILFLSLLTETERRGGRSPSAMVTAWLTAVAAIPFATSGNPPTIEGSGDAAARVDVETTLWIECALLARYASSRLLAANPLPADYELELLSVPIGSIVSTLREHIRSLRSTSGGALDQRTVAAIKKLEALLNSSGIVAGKVYSSAPSAARGEVRKD